VEGFIVGGGKSSPIGERVAGIGKKCQASASWLAPMTSTIRKPLVRTKACLKGARFSGPHLEGSRAEFWILKERGPQHVFKAQGPPWLLQEA
jgi:hypothetical protein